MTTPGTDWVEQARRFAAGLAGDHPGITDALGGLLGSSSSADHSAECRSCPLCTALAAVRGRRPDLLEALADVLTGAASALRTTAAAGAPTPEAPDTPPEETVSHPAPAPAVQRIDVA
jgi:hypothetical protein